jgi:hypothetical protein
MDSNIPAYGCAHSDALAWAVPGLAVAAEAFLLTVALAPNTQPAGRLGAAIAGVLVLAASLHLMWKQMFNFHLVDANINYQRQLLGLMGLRRDDLLRDVNSFPRDENLRSKGYLERPLRRRLVVYWRANSVWIWLLRLLILLDVLIGVYAVLEWSGSDPGWLHP